MGELSKWSTTFRPHFLPPVKSFDVDWPLMWTRLENPFNIIYTSLYINIIFQPSRFIHRQLIEAHRSDILKCQNKEPTHYSQSISFFKLLPLIIFIICRSSYSARGSRAHRKATVTISYFLSFSVCQRVDFLFHARHLFEAATSHQPPDTISNKNQGEAIANKK